MKFTIVSESTSEVKDRDPNLYVRRAEDSLRRNQSEEALREMDEAIEYAPANNKVKYAFEKVRVFDAIGQHGECWGFIKSYLKRFYSELPLSDFYFVLRVLKNNSVNDPTAMLEQHGIPSILMQVYQSGRADKAFFFQKAKDYKGKRDFANALKITELISSKFGDDADICLLKAQIYREEGSLSTAATYYAKAAGYRSPSLVVFTEIIEVHEQLNKMNDALDWVDKGLVAFPINRELLYKKADLLYKRGNYEHCLEVANVILEKNPADAKAFYWKGLVYDHQKRYPLAKRFFEKAAAINPNLSTPSNPDREHYLSRLKKLIVTISTAAVLLLVGQFIMFATGMVKPIEYGISLDTDEVVFVGETMSAYEDYHFFPFYAKKPEITYRIADPEIAMVTTNGDIKGLKVGATSIEMVEGDHVLATSRFKVVKPEVSKVELEVSSKDLEIGETAKVSAEVEMDYDEVESPVITYKSSKPSIISVNQDGEVEAKGIGDAKITATAGGKSSSVTVHSYAKVDEILLDTPEELKVQVGKNITLTPTVKTTPEKGDIYPLHYETSDNTIATVNSNGEVTGVAEGEVDITITSLHDVEKKIKVMVTEDPVIEKPSDLTAVYDQASQTIRLSWKYDSLSEENVQFKVYDMVDNGDFQELTTISQQSLSIAISSSEGTNYTFQVVATVNDATSDVATTSIQIPSTVEGDNSSSGVGSENGNGNDNGNNNGNVNVDSGTTKSPAEIQKDKDVAKMISLMKGVMGYWKNASPDSSDYRDLKYAVIGDDSTDSRQNSFEASYLAQSYYDGMSSGFWEYGLRQDWIRLEGSTLYDTEGDSITIQSTNKFILKFKNGFHGNTNKTTFTFIRCKKSDIPNEYLRNSSVTLP